jgi:site-specific DNA-methyltransferase (adenine-specific)
VQLINNDCIAAMKAMPDNSVDSIVTDPPYELGFMGKSWDASGIAFNVDVWRQALRVLKPGGHLIAFSGSRTYHRMAVAIEDAGFEIRDQIMWVYGSGFPKSHNISKGIDKSAGAEREVVGERKQRANSDKSLVPMNASVDEVEYITAPSTAEAKQWDGWGTALKPAHEPMVLARKPLEGTVANNVLTFGVGGLNIDGTRVGSEIITQSQVTSTSGNPADGAGGQRVNVPQKANGVVTQTTGRFPANFIHDGSDEVVALFPNVKGQVGMTKDVGGHRFIVGDLDSVQKFTKSTTDSGSAARFFYCAKASKRDRNEGLDGFEAKRDHDGRADGGVGGDNPRNRTNNAKLNHHPTVKPTSLMQYLIRLVTPPNGIVLDPFMGSGSTGKACAYEGFDFIGIDQSAEYVAIAQARIDFALADKSNELPL